MSGDKCSIQFVMGPAGSGKTTYCKAMQQHVDTMKSAKQQSVRSSMTLHIANLDPAADYYNDTSTNNNNTDQHEQQQEYLFDIRDIISVTDVMNELNLGPNGALVYCMEYLLTDGMDWLLEQLDTLREDDLLLIDCPGQIELYTHIPVQKQLINIICNQWGYNGNVCSVFCIDSGFCLDTSKFISGSLLTLSTMISLEIPHITLLTKCDLLNEQQINRILNYTSAIELWNMEENNTSFITNNYHFQQKRYNTKESITTSSTDYKNDNRNSIEDEQNDNIDNDENDTISNNSINDDNNNITLTQEDVTTTSQEIVTTNELKEEEEQQQQNELKEQHQIQIQLQIQIQKEKQYQIDIRRQKRNKLTLSLISVIDDWSMVSYLPCNIYDEDNMNTVLLTINHTIQFGENNELYEPNTDDNDNDYYDDYYNDNNNTNDDNDNDNNDYNNNAAFLKNYE